MPGLCICVVKVDSKCPPTESLVRTSRMLPTRGYVKNRSSVHQQVEEHFQECLEGSNRESEYPTEGVCGIGCDCL